MAKKLGRNDLCWCGSGVKHKKCHLGREQAEPVKPWEVASEQKRAFSKKYCLHPSASPTACQDGIVRAHTVQKNGVLSRIAENGHVYSGSADFFDLVKSNGKVVQKLTGINDASTFTGFCGFHDNKIFEPVEKYSFTGTQEQCFLLAYRAICREVFVKKNALDAVPFMKTLDKGKPVDQQTAIQLAMMGNELGLTSGLADLELYKATYDQILLSGQYSDICYYIVWFENTPDIMCSSLLYPECDFAGNAIQDLADFNKKLDLITYSLIATEKGGAFVFVWSKDSDNSCLQLVKSLDALTDDLIPHAIVRFLFEFCENKYLSPKWWNELSADNRKSLEDRTMLGLSPVHLRSSRCLLDDGLRAVSWEAISRESNII